MPRWVVEFWAYSGTRDRMETVCRAILEGRRIVYTGRLALEVQEMVRENDYLKPWRARGGLRLLSRLPGAFHGAYFWATSPRRES